MTRPIIVPVDGSNLAERALPLAGRLAGALGSRVTIVQAIPAVAEPTVDVAGAEAYLKGLMRRIPGVESAETTVVIGDAASAIIETAQRQGAMMIVMSTHGRSGLGRWLYGSVADQVMRGARVPVILVPVTGAVEWPSDRPARILVPLDGSPLAESVIGPVEQLAAKARARLILVRAVDSQPFAYADPSALSSIDPTLEITLAQEYLEEIAKRLRAGGQNVSYRVELGPAVSTIIDVAREVRADLIALATHGRGGLSRLVLGSVATGVVQRAAVPVMVVRASLGQSSWADTGLTRA